MKSTRRDFLHIGGLAAFGGFAALGLELPRWCAAREQREEGDAPRAAACILLWLDGGPSHLETFDPKPEAPREIRGPFRAIPSALPGMALSEHLPRTAALADQLTVIRSLTSPLGEHGLANRYLLSGYEPTPALEYPSLGSVVAHERGGKGSLPPYVVIPEEAAGFSAGYLGSAFRPFVTGGDPGKGGFRVDHLEPPPGFALDRLERRRAFLRQFDRWQSAAEGAAPETPGFERAFRMVTSREAKQAFDLAAEPPVARARYGPRTFGQSCLLARRLIERGVPLVTVRQSGWDTHGELNLRLYEGYAGAREGVGLIPTFDQAFSALLTDLNERGLLGSTLVIAMGEFGRTPKINTTAGRDHWPRVFSALLAGGGAPSGLVLGASDRRGESVRERPITPADLAGAVYRLLGIDPARELLTPEGRPVRINAHGALIPEFAA